MQGKRIADDSQMLQPGEYAKLNGIWHAATPAKHFVANLASHKVTEHEDGTISVEPSILVTNHHGSWHGFLERGVWREC